MLRSFEPLTDGNVPLLHRHCTACRYARFNTPRVQAAVAEYARIAKEAGMTPAQLAYAFCGWVGDCVASHSVGCGGGGRRVTTRVL